MVPESGPRKIGGSGALQGTMHGYLSLRARALGACHRPSGGTDLPGSGGCPVSRLQRSGWGAPCNPGVLAGAGSEPEMKVLVLGSGGREHALAWRMVRDSGVEKVFVMPGNPGMQEPLIEPLLNQLTIEETLVFCKRNSIDFVMIGPERFLLEGWADSLAGHGVPVVGPSAKAALLEGSKAFAKEFMRSRGIPTARFFKANTREGALHAISSMKDWAGVVVKLSGPALGKGVVVTRSLDEARSVVNRFFDEGAQGIEDGMVLEELLSGQEVSLFYACLGTEYRFLGSACDHKRLLDGDHGPNTGGMGAVSPAPALGREFLNRVEAQVLVPTLRGMDEAGTPYNGILFLGLMGESMLEYNVRFGDPETQALMPILSGHFTRFLKALAMRDSSAFRSAELGSTGDASIHVVKAALGYPGGAGKSIESGVELERNPRALENQGKKWFFAGVKTPDFNSEGRLVTSGGRVLGLTAWAGTDSDARNAVYRDINDWRFAGEQYRCDIGRRS
ncbi:MAG: phosphoribosylamine--glycine ligase [Proteobacteria bacterium]|nr:phosphoribosylamine--glycine ligase [Pseudomonadota bacterium]